MLFPAFGTNLDWVVLFHLKFLIKQVMKNGNSIFKESFAFWYVPKSFSRKVLFFRGLHRFSRGVLVLEVAICF